jgi:hypothetical protein
MHKRLWNKQVAGPKLIEANTTAETRLIANLRKQAEQWEALATEARQRADQHRRGDLDPAYLYGCADQLERSRDPRVDR